MTDTATTPSPLMATAADELTLGSTVMCSDGKPARVIRTQTDELALVRATLGNGDRLVAVNAKTVERYGPFRVLHLPDGEETKLPCSTTLPPPTSFRSLRPLASRSTPSCRRRLRPPSARRSTRRSSALAPCRSATRAARC